MHCWQIVSSYQLFLKTTVCHKSVHLLYICSACFKHTMEELSASSLLKINLSSQDWYFLNKTIRQAKVTAANEAEFISLDNSVYL